MINGLSPSSSAALADAAHDLSFRPGELVYRQGELATGAYIVTSGRIKLTATSSHGKAVIVRVVNSGGIIGLSAALTAGRNDTSAETLEPARVSYINAESLYDLMRDFNDLSLWLAKQLSLEYFALCRELALLGLRRSATSRLAKVLLDMFEDNELKSGELKIKCRLTHEQIAQIIGTSRETVTRSLTDLRQSAIATLNGDTLWVNNIDELRVLAH